MKHLASNLQIMKKFIKSKIDHNEAVTEKVMEKVTDQKPVITQPPLPVDPPPAPSPPVIITTPKKEIIDPLEDFPLTIDTTIVKKEDKPKRIKVIKEAQTINEDKKDLKDDKKMDVDKDRSKVPICKNFLRHNCTRTVCIFRHEYDLTKLQDVYKFCKDFQNSICTYPNCKYVHATVFEQERFYKTGILPPNALSHQKRNHPPGKPYTNGLQKNFMLLPPPPPPPPPPTNENGGPSQFNINMNVTHPPPAMSSQIGVDRAKQFPVVNSFPSAAFNSSTLCDVNASVQDQEVNAKHANKCEHCEHLENRLQLTKLKVENMSKSTLESNDKLLALERKQKRLVFCILSLLKPAMSQSNLSDTLVSLGHAYPSLNLPESSMNSFKLDEQNKGSALTEQLKNLIQATLNNMNTDESKMLGTSSHSNMNVSSLATQMNLHTSWGGHT